MNARHLLWLVKRRLVAPELVSYYGQLLRNQFLAAADVAAMNWKSRKALVKHAFESSPFYRRRMDEVCLRPEDISSEEMWQPQPSLGPPPLPAAQQRDFLQEGLASLIRPLVQQED
jgi:phenylacetate-coenzyme A ligase PaaK-like adenylate-forming protein